MTQKQSWVLVSCVALTCFATGARRAHGAPSADDVKILAQADAGADAAAGKPAAATAQETVPALPAAKPGAAAAAEAAMPPVLEEVLGQEELRRRAEEEHGLQSLDEAELAMKNKDYQTAIRKYEEARKYVGSRPETAEQRKRVEAGYPESLYRWAVVLRNRKDLEEAKKYASEAVKQGHKKALKLGEEIQAEIQKPPPPPPPPRPRWGQTEFTTEMKEIEDLLSQGRQYFATGEYEQAQETFDRVLKRDADNTEAIRWLRKTAQKRYDRASMELEATRRDMMTQLRQTWNPRDYGLMEKPEEPKGLDTGKRKEYDAEKARRLMIEKMDAIKIPEIDFRQGNIYDVISFLSTASIENDRTSAPDEKKGVDIILNLGGPAPAAKAEGSANPFAEDIGGAGAAPAAGEGGGAKAAGSGEIPLITFHARYISLHEALRIVTSVAGLKYTIRGSIVMVVPLDSPEQDIVVRMYDVVPGVEERLTTTAAEVSTAAPKREEGTDFIGIGTANISRERADWRAVFEGLGVQWPRGSSIQYMPSIAKIIVRNTPENLASFEEVLEALNVVPSQIEIEARFVEVQQKDLDALGFEWLLSDDWELAERSSQQYAPTANRERIVMPRNDLLGGFTRAMRFAPSEEDLALNNFSDDILRIGGVLTNPELGVVLHAINQMGGTDLLSAPKVTTQSGQEATIKVVTEYIYPTEFTVEPIVGYSGGQYAGSSQPIGAVVEPGGFETREVGVILTVLPEVSAEGQMITLTLAPEVVSDPTWRNYGSTYQTYQVDQATQSPLAQNNSLPMEQPFFHTRSVTTTINIYNGATVMMGGMITETRVNVDDKIPLIGDLPLVGRLFRSRYEKSEKKNLLIFVTARLVDPAGRPIKKSKAEDLIKDKIIQPVEPAATTAAK